jgi:hypothetical protein
MTTAQLPFRADIAGAMPPTMMKDVEGVLSTSSRLLGMYEAYKAFAECASFFTVWFNNPEPGHLS